MTIDKYMAIQKKKGDEVQEKDFALAKKNYIYLAIGFAIIVLGFILMCESPSADDNVFKEEIYGFRCISLAPMVVLAGFVFEIYAIMKKF